MMFLLAGVYVSRPVWSDGLSKLSSCLTVTGCHLNRVDIDYTFELTLSRRLKPECQSNNGLQLKY